MRQKQKIINVYEDYSISSVKHVISIANEEDLNHFWHYFNVEVATDHKHLNHFISLMYAFTENLFRLNKALFFELIIEQNEDVFYLTIWNSKVSLELDTLLEEQDGYFEYLMDSKRLSIKITKDSTVEEERTYDKVEKERVSLLLESVQKDVCVIPKVCDVLEEGDKIEILSLCDDMTDMMYRAKGIRFHDDVLIRLRSLLSMFSLSLMSYSQFSNISNLMIEFSVLMNTHMVEFKKMPSDEFALVEGFINNIDRWANALFVTGSVDFHFMDSSLKADIDMIQMLIDPPQVDELSMDDIFEF
ncbi:hypothetical protein JHD50_02625 [Sulfurimonas sp. MAG313]|nr:hypothetical protein [Sulfurimonas sp. MAG313]MDF1880207.1 hypothetical protein [Sulfurimonas sp. MAG313]